MGVKSVSKGAEYGVGLVRVIPKGAAQTHELMFIIGGFVQYRARRHIPVVRQAPLR